MKLKIAELLAIGKYNQLEVLKTVDFGLYLDGGPYGEILLPQRYVPEGTEVGQELEVFLYNDSEDRLIATTERPLATVGEFAFLEAKEVGEYGAFLEWGLPKDLLVPFREQALRMQRGQSYLVYVYLDDSTDRIAASSRWKRFVEEKDEAGELQVDEEVSIFIAERTDLGYKVVINHRFQGILYHNQIFQSIAIGDQLPAYIDQVREDQRIDVRLQQVGVAGMNEAATELLAHLQLHDGYLPLTDKSPPEAIYAQLQMSKKAFKKAVGNLYKQRLIQLEKQGIRLVKA